MAGVSSARRLAGSPPLSEELDRLHRAAQALCGSPHDTEDLVQETLVRVLARPRRLRRGSEQAYLLAALRNTFLHSVRTAGRRPQAMEASDRLRSARADPEAAFELQELLATIAALQSGFATRWWPSTRSDSPRAPPSLGGGRLRRRDADARKDETRASSHSAARFRFRAQEWQRADRDPSLSILVHATHASLSRAAALPGRDGWTRASASICSSG